MYQKLKESFEFDGQPINKDLWDEMKTQSNLLQIKKKEVLIPYGSNKKYVYFIASGSFMLTLSFREGEGKAVWFHLDSMSNMATCADSYFLNEPTKYELIALENSTVIRFSKKSFDSWVLKYAMFNQFYIRGITYERIAIQESRALRMLCTPEEYLNFINEKYPQLTKRIPSKYIAHFLGISPEWYSKLKKKASLN